MLLRCGRLGVRGNKLVGRACLLASFGLASACGSRSMLSSEELEEGRPPETPVVECVRDSDCERPCFVMGCQDGHCAEVSAVLCDDGDPCTSNDCDPSTGACVFTPLTPDADGDGHRAPLPGFLPGEPGSCGDDCDDTSALAYPGGIERCDGRDNDCDGIVDNGALYLTPRFDEPVRVGTEDLHTSRGRGLAFGSGVFAASYGGRTPLSTSYLRGLDSSGRSVFEQASVTNVNVMSFGAVLGWSGNAFGAAWTDPRVDGNYEIYFALFNQAGARLGSDVRVSNAPHFSIHPFIMHDSGRFAVVWDDRRDSGTDDRSVVYGQLIDNGGGLVGENQPLSAFGLISEYPKLAATGRRFGLVYTVIDADGVSVLFQSFDKNFRDPGGVTIVATGNAAAPHVAALGDRFVVTWGTYTDAPGPAIWGAVLDERGEEIVGPRPITAGAEFARTHTTVSLGDRFVLLWADTFDGNYDLYGTTLSPSFEVLEERTRLTFDEADSLGPVAALSEDGTLGVLFDDWRAGGRQVYFTALACTIP